MSSNTSGETGGQGGCSAPDGVSGLMPGGVLVPARIRGSVGAMHCPGTSSKPLRLGKRVGIPTANGTVPVRSHVQLLQRFSTCYRNQEHRIMEPTLSAVDARRPLCRSYVRCYLLYHQDLRRSRVHLRALLIAPPQEAQRGWLLLLAPTGPSLKVSTVEYLSSDTNV